MDGDENMKCRYCKMEWSGPEETLGALKECPFCRKPLLSPQEAGKKMSFRQVLALVAEVGGREAMRNGSMLLSYFSDYAPALAKEKRLLRVFVDAGGNEALLSALEEDKGQIGPTREQVVSRLTREYFITEAAAREVCGAFLYSLGEAAESEETEQTAESRPSDDGKPAPTEAQASSRQKKLEVVTSMLREMQLHLYVDSPLLYRENVGFEGLLKSMQKKVIRKPLDNDEKAILLYDESFMGAGSQGFVLTTKGFYAKRSGAVLEVPLERCAHFDPLVYEQAVCFAYLRGDGSPDMWKITGMRTENDTCSFSLGMNEIMKELLGEQWEKNVSMALNG